MSSAVETGSQHLGNDLSTLLDMAYCNLGR